MRRYVNGLVTPSKEAVRKRLFQTPSPKKSRRTMSDWRRNALWDRSRTKQALLVLACFAVVVPLLVQQVAFEKSTTAEEWGDVAIRPPQPMEGSLKSNSAILRGGPPQKQQQKHHHQQQQIGKLAPLRPIDYEQYTIRINTWRRPEQLLVSIDHHANCPGVAQIQIVWCDTENEPPAEVLAWEQETYDNVDIIVERHEANTLNERFNILTTPTPTLGILSIDDDVLRPCEAMDAGFFKWTQSPHRMVGFDGRMHVEKDDGTWQYGYMSTTEKANKYSLSLTRYCFIHRDYMDMYINDLPKPILEKVAKEFNCEDIAMSFLVSSVTGGKPSLLADLWAIKSMVKLYVVEKISGTKNHKNIRDECVDSFAHMLGLKHGQANRLHPATYVHKKDAFFECGAADDDDLGLGDIEDHHYPKPTRQVVLEEKCKQWHSQGSTMQKDIQKMMAKAGFRAYQQGLVEKSDKWKERFGQKNNSKTQQS